MTTADVAAFAVARQMRSAAVLEQMAIQHEMLTTQRDKAGLPVAAECVRLSAARCAERGQPLLGGTIAFEFPPQ